MNPTWSTFSPRKIAWQNQFVYDFYNQLEWSKGVHEIMLSGAIGSAKSSAMAWIAVTECLTKEKNRGFIGRLSLPDLKKTIFQEILNMLDDSELVEGIDYTYQETTASFYFPRTKSEIIAGSWADKRYKKFRSLQLGFAIIEEATESEGEKFQAYEEIVNRVGRLNHIDKQFVLVATNPSDPSSVWYKHFIESNDELRHVYYSVTEDNPFLPKTYIEKLKRNLAPLMAERMLFGKWIEISKDKIYHSYSKDRNFSKDNYEINYSRPIIITFDFNIAAGKPMSATSLQYINDHFHFFDEAVVHGARTLDLCEEIYQRGYLRPGTKIVIHGDAAGKHRDTRSIQSDYTIIETYFKSIPGIEVKMEVPLSNPPVRNRHNRVNAYCHNAKGESRLTVYSTCPVLDEGLRLTALKDGADYIEDDSKAYQHVTTAAGYAIVYETNRSQTTIEFQTQGKRRF